MTSAVTACHPPDLLAAVTAVDQLLRACEQLGLAWKHDTAASRALRQDRVALLDAARRLGESLAADAGELVQALTAGDPARVAAASPRVQALVQSGVAEIGRLAERLRAGRGDDADARTQAHYLALLGRLGCAVPARP